MKRTNFITFHKNGLLFALCCSLVVTLLGYGYIGVGNYFAGRIYPLIKIAEVQAGSYRLDEVIQKLKDIYSPSRPVIFETETKKVSALQGEVGLKIEIDKAVKEAYQSGRTTTFDREIDLKASVDEAKLTNYLRDRFSENIIEPQNAQYKIDDDKLLIEGDRSGKTFDYPSILHNLNRLALSSDPIIIPVILIDSDAKIKTTDLQIIQDKVESEINRKLLISVNAKIYSPNKSDLLSFITISSSANRVDFDLSQENIKTYAEKLASKTDVNPKSDVYYSTGELSEQGFDGKKINLDTATEKIYQALKNNEDSVILESETVSKGKKTIEKPFTPGMYPGKYIEVDLSSQRLYQFEGDRLVGEKVVSTGKWSMPTPVGTFSINSKNPRAYSSTYDLYMPYWMAFIGSKYGLHELPEWANGKKEGQDHLGRPVSHGCIRMGVGDAEQVFNWAEIGTPVVIHK